MHADGYAGFEQLYRSGTISEVACLTHIRRKFFEEAQSKRTPIASEALTRFAALYAVEAEIRGQPPDQRAAARQAKARPVFDDLITWLQSELPKISGKSDLAKAIRYALTRLPRNF